MTGGFLRGALLGCVLSVGAALVISVLVPLPSPPQVSVASAETGQPPQPSVDVDVVAAGAQPDSTPDISAATPVAVAEPTPDSLTAVAPAQDSAQAPQTGTAETLAPPMPADDGQVAGLPTPEAPVLPNPQALAPMLPEAADTVEVSTEPAEVPAPPQPQGIAQVEVTTDPAELAVPQEVQQSELAATLQPTGSDTAAAAAPQPLRMADADAQIAEPQPASRPKPVVADVTPTPPAEDVAQTPAQGTVAVEAPVADSAPAEIAVAEPTPDAGSPETPDTPVVVADDVADADEDADVALAPSEPNPDQSIVTSVDTPVTRDNLQSTENGVAPAVRIGKPVGSLVDRAGAVKINRAPGASSQITLAEAPVETQPDQAQAADGPPIRQFAAPFDNQDGRPLMSIVLIDTGETLEGADVDFAALGSFPYPLSFAVDTSLSDAEDRMAQYRAEGFEVLAMIDLPEGAAPADAEVAMSVLLDRVPEVVGVLEGTRGGLQGSREVSDQVTQILLQSGHGLVAQPQGLNTMPKLARKAGVPAKPVFRDFDSNGQNARVIRRFLDQAAFKAAQEGGVIMLGRLQPETIKALLVWALADRASQVALAPVSAVLLTD